MKNYLVINQILFILSIVFIPLFLNVKFDYQIVFTHNLYNFCIMC